MISYHEALSFLLKHCTPLPTIRVGLEESLGAVLGRDVRARFDTPRFDQTAMDGFAVRSEDVKRARKSRPVRLEVIGTISAGDSKRPGVHAGTAVKILTGGRIPPGADAVVIKEVCEEEGNGVLVRKPIPKGGHIRFRGEEFKKGDIVLRQLTRIGPPEIGMLAIYGHSTVKVYRQPRVTIAVTGNELVPPGKPLAAGQIYDSNSYMLAAALEELGIREVQVLRIKDSKSSLRKGFRKALNTSDVLITVGGVSVGDYDFVKEVLEQEGVKTVYWGVAVKPGKPNYFGVRPKSRNMKRDKAVVFGLPGNPVSALVSYHEFVKFGLRCMNEDPSFGPGRALMIPLSKAIKRRPGRLEWMRGTHSYDGEEWTVTPTPGQGSHMLGGMTAADCLIEIPADKGELKEGELVRVKLISWGP